MFLKQISRPEIINKLPPQVHKIFAIFIEKGDEIRLVGGCVRDLLLNIEVNDFDFATKFLPHQIIAILSKNNIKAIATGLEFGTVTAVIDGKNFEITTLRKDIESDGRYCKAEFIDDYFFDAARRDFTINALYLDQYGNIYDYFDGILHLQQLQVKFIGDAEIRIKEDFLRILRFFRFSCKYAKKLDEQGLSACINNKENIKNLSRERIRTEFLKLINSPNKDFLLEILQKLQQHKITNEIFTCEIDCKNLSKIFLFKEEIADLITQNLQLSALFLYKVKNWQNFYFEICATNLEKKYFQFLIKNLLNSNAKIDQNFLKKLLVSYEKKLVLDLYILYSVKQITKEQKQFFENLLFIKNFTLPYFPLSGEDLKTLGFEKRAIAVALEFAKNYWCENNFLPTKTDLINFIQLGSLKKSEN